MIFPEHLGLILAEELAKLVVLGSHAIADR